MIIYYPIQQLIDQNDYLLRLQTILEFKLKKYKKLSFAKTSKKLTQSSVQLSQQVEKHKMSSLQMQIVYMIGQLDGWGKELGSANARRKMTGSEFDACQEEFLVKRHEVQTMQNEKEKSGLNTKTASFGYKIREGISEMETALGRMKEEARKLAKKKQVPDHSERRQKIIDNCQKLLQDIKQRQTASTDPNGYIKPAKILTLTDMRSKLLSDIEEQNFVIHNPTEGSEDQLADSNVEEQEAMRQYAERDKEMDDALDGIIDGIQGVKGKVRQINEKQDQIIQKTNKNKKHVEKVSKRIQTDNDKLKKIIKKFGPSRCCLSLTLLLLFIGLIVVIIKMFVLK